MHDPSGKSKNGEEVEETGSKPGGRCRCRHRRFRRAGEVEAEEEAASVPGLAQEGEGATRAERVECV
jgi:hypothetical protein